MDLYLCWTRENERKARDEWKRTDNHGKVWLRLVLETVWQGRQSGPFRSARYERAAERVSARYWPIARLDRAQRDVWFNGSRLVATRWITIGRPETTRVAWKQMYVGRAIAKAVTEGFLLLVARREKKEKKSNRERTGALDNRFAGEPTESSSLTNSTRFNIFITMSSKGRLADKVCTRRRGNRRSSNPRQFRFPVDPRHFPRVELERCMHARVS